MAQSKISIRFVAVLLAALLLEANAANAYVSSIIKVINAQQLQPFCSTFISAASQPAVTTTLAGKTYKRTTTVTSTRTSTKIINAKATLTTTIASNVAASTQTTITSPSTVYQTLPTPISSAIATTSGATTVFTTSTAYSTSKTAKSVVTSFTTQGVPVTPGYVNKRSLFPDDALQDGEEDTESDDMNSVERRADTHWHAVPVKKHNHPVKRAPATKKPAKSTKTSKKKTPVKNTSTKTPNKLASSSIPSALAKYNKASISAACATVFKAVTIQTKGAAVYSTQTKTVYASATTSSTSTQFATSRVTTTVTTGTNTFTQTSYSPIVTVTSTPGTSTVYRTTTIITSSFSVVSGTGTTTSTSTLVAPTTYVYSTAKIALPSPTFVDYKTLSNQFQHEGDVLPDYSWAGYHASNVGLPANNIPATTKLRSTGDQTDRTNDIQNALNACNGGVVELQAGIYYINGGTISLTQSNCIFRGALNSGDPQAVVVMTGQVRSAFTIGSPKQLSPIWQNSENITDDYVGVGTNIINVVDASTFSVGSQVAVQRTVSAQWIQTMGMDNLVRNGANQTWIPVGATLNQFRTIVSISNNTLTVDIPLTDAVDNIGQYDNGTVTSYTSPATYSEIGIENLFIVAVPDETGTDIVSGNGAGVTFGSWVTDSWSRNIVFEGYNGPTSVGRYSSRITLASNQFRRDLTTDNSAGQAADVLLNGQQVLVTGAITLNNPGSYTFGVTTGSAVPGPNVAFNCTSVGYDVTAPHQRWATGFLIDASITARSIFGNRGILGSGQGWVMGAGVNWNVIGFRGFQILAPPISMNFCVGCIGTTFDGNGTIISSNQPVLPASLYVAQLQARIGNAAAAAAIKY